MKQSKVNGVVDTKKKEATVDGDILLPHLMFIAGLQDLTQEEIYDHFFGLMGREGIVLVDLWPDSRGKIGLSSVKLIHDLLELKKIKIADRVTIDMKPFQIKPENKDKRNYMVAFEDEEKLATYEKQAKNASLSAKTIKIVENRKEHRVPAIFEPGKEYAWTITVRNTGVSKAFYGIEFLSKRPEFITYDRIPAKMNKNKQTGKKEPDHVIIEGGEKYDIGIKFSPKTKHFGNLRQVLLFQFRVTFGTFKTKFQDFVKDFVVSVTVGNEEELKLLQPISDYKLVEEDPFLVKTVVPAFSPSRKSLPQFISLTEVPAWSEGVEEYALSEKVIKEIESNPADPTPLSKENYKKRYHQLLWTEEMNGRKNCRTNDIHEATLEKTNIVTEKNARPVVATRLEVLGLQDKRPSLYLRDIIYASIPGTTDTEYEGIIYKVEPKHLVVLFCEDFHDKFNKEGTKFTIRFPINRMGLRHLHRAVDNADINLVWPDELKDSVRKGPPVDLRSLQFFDKDLNADQKQFILQILNNSNGNAPFLLFGPFGTGKTRTLAELAKQLVKLQNGKVMVCCKSNSSADSFVEKLKLLITNKEMFRLNPHNRGVKNVPDSILPYSLYREEKGIFEVPAIDALKNFKVVVTTCFASALLNGAGLGNNHFTHILIDEAGQISEPEVLIPLCLANKDTRLILAGDDKQVGPLFQSPSVQIQPLNKSILERMTFKSTVYQEKENRRVCMQFTTAYRCHSKILEFSSNEFYDGRLQSAAETKFVNSLLNWDRLPNKSFPCFFYSVEGEDLREASSPSFFNPHEASAIAHMISDLLSDQKITAEEIGVVTSYYKQTEKIRLLLRTKGLGSVKVGGVEDFVANEKRALFVSTVRSSRGFKDLDRKYNLGLLNSPKRFNTAVTRACALLVVVGDPYVLYQDEHWHNFMHYCNENKSYIGPRLTEDYILSRAKQEKPLTLESLSSTEGKEEGSNEPQAPSASSPEEIRREKQPVENITPPAWSINAPNILTKPKEPTSPTASMPIPIGKPHSMGNLASSMELKTTSPISLSSLNEPNLHSNFQGSSVDVMDPIMPNTSKSIQAPITKPQMNQNQPLQSPSSATYSPLYSGAFSAFSQAPQPANTAMYNEPPMGNYPYFPNFSYGNGYNTGTSSFYYTDYSYQSSNQAELNNTSQKLEAEFPVTLEEHTQGYNCLYTYQDEYELIHYNTSFGCPPLSVIEQDNVIEIRISLFQVKANVKHEGNRVIVDLEIDSKVKKNSLFLVGGIHATNVSSSSKLPNAAKLVVTLPPLFDPRLVEVLQSQLQLVITATKST